MKRKSILLVLCIGMILTSCESKISLNSTDVKNEKNQKNTTMENPDKGYNLPIDEDKKKEAVNDCEEIMGIIRDIYSEYNGIQEADQNTAEQMMNRMKEIIKQNGNPVIGSDHYSVMDNYQKMEQFLKSAEQEEKGSVILYEADTDGGITRKEYSYDGKEMSVMSAKMIWSEDTEPVLTYISLSKIKEWAYTENGNFCYELCVPEPPEGTEIVDGSCIIRVKPLSEECREYSKKYVSTFGYQGNNLLCSNWNAEDMQGLDYNGLYEYFYQMKYGEKFTAEKEVVGIPAEEFENVIMTYLPVTKAELKESAVGRPIIVRNSLGYLLNQNLVKIHGKNNKDSRFIYYQFLQPRYSQYIATIQRGNANQANIAISDLWNYRIFITKHNEQQKIGNFFQQLDFLITLHQRKLEKLKQLKKFLLQNMFI